MRGTRIAAGALAIGVVAALTGCGSAGSSGNSIKVVYLDDGNSAMKTYMNDVTKDFESSHKNVTVDLEPIKATESDFYTKVALMQRTASTAPDVVYEDTFQIKADASAGYLTPLNSYVAKWSDWSKFVSAGRVGGQGADGKQYGIPLGTDTQGLWYNKLLFQKAGISVPWQPKNWADITATAKILKAKLPGVTPINIFASKAGGEASSVRGAQTILSGTGDSLYTGGKWVTSSPGLTSTFDFIRSIYKDGLALPNQTTSDPNYGNIPWGLLKSGKLAIDADGSFIANNWQSGGSSPWPAWTTTMAVAKWPTENGQAPGSTSMSGGWTFAVGSKSKAPATAFSYIETALNKKNSLAYAIGLSNIPVRSDVASDPTYLKSNPTASFFSGQVAVTHFRPAIAAYPQISNQLTVATDAITTGNSSVASAISAYGKAVVGIVGQSKTTTQ